MHLSTGTDAGWPDAVPQMTRTGVYSARIRGRETRHSKHFAAKEHKVHFGSNVTVTVSLQGNLP